MLHFARIMLLLGWIPIYYHEVSGTVAPCAENRTEQCIQNLATFISLENPRFVTETELEGLCREADYGQRCSSDFLRSSSCVNAQDEILIPLQIGRSQEVSKMICPDGFYITDPAFRKAYLQHSPCIDKHSREIKDCYSSANMVEDPEMEIVRNSTKTNQEKQLSVCCPMVQYIECSLNAIGTNCGTESKIVLLRVLLAASGKQLDEFCKNMNSLYPDSPAACTSSALQLVASTVINLFSFFLIFVACTMF